MTTDDEGEQLTLQPRERELALLQRALELRLDSLRSWAKLPDDNVDWSLEQLLDELTTYARAYRALRNESDVPF